MGCAWEWHELDDCLAPRECWGVVVVLDVAYDTFRELFRNVRDVRPEVVDSLCGAGKLVCMIAVYPH